MESFIKSPAWQKLLQPYPLSLPDMMIVIGCFLIFSYSLDYYISSNYILLRECLLRGIALINFMSIYSLSLQIFGLIGSKGLIPLPFTLLKLKKMLDNEELLKKQSISLSQAQGHLPLLVENKFYLTFVNIVHEYKMKIMHKMLWIIYERFAVHPSNQKEEEINENEEIASSSKKTKKNAFDEHLQFLIRFDLILAILAIFYPHFLFFIYFYFINYSYKRVLGPFYNFQWDVLLLESLFLSGLLGIYSFPLIEKDFLEIFLIWMIKLLFFRLMFGSGMVKLYGNDHSWNQDCNAMSYHFWTQPLPNNLGRFIHLSSPMWLFILITLATHLSEIPYPIFSMILPNSWFSSTFLLFWGNVFLQISIMTTGYFGFFNTLTIILSFSLINDNFLWETFSVFLPSTFISSWKAIVHTHTYLGRAIVQQYVPIYIQIYQFIVNYFIVFPILLLISIVYFIAILQLLERTNWIRKEQRSPSTSSAGPSDSVNPPKERRRGGDYRDYLEVLYYYFLVIHEFFNHLFYLGGHYGLFANMTKNRYEINVYLTMKEVESGSSLLGKNEREGNSDPKRLAKEAIEKMKAEHQQQQDKDRNNTQKKKKIQEEKELDEDGLEWDLISFRYKPDNIYSLPKLIFPYFHMPRFDWCCWFLSFKPMIQLYPKWFFNFLLAVMEFMEHPELSQDIIDLLDSDSKELLIDLRSQLLLSEGEREGEGGGTNDKNRKRKMLFLKVTHSLYEYNPNYSSSSSLSSSASSVFSHKSVDGIPISIYQQPVWLKKNEKLLLKPMNLTQLYQIYDIICEKEDGTPASRKERDSRRQSAVERDGKDGKPTVETAAEIIMKTFEKFAKTKKQESHHQQRSNKKDD